jgi:hypothetical protein
LRDKENDAAAINLSVLETDSSLLKPPRNSGGLILSSMLQHTLVHTIYLCGTFSLMVPIRLIILLQSNCRRPNHKRRKVANKEDQENDERFSFSSYFLWKLCNFMR